MKFTQKELETIKDALTIAINESAHMLNDTDDVIKILDRIDEESDLD
jgi:hypothetical protein